ncbi:MAG TPA: methyltransferase domain-containing protein [Kribbella sp.]|uniref:methyltransferase domain-containing protein n=1 Tax=Kribbella sp. TaxID=1871183 RepID=UPI002D770385|nr:methyltransferase domain-containing protein [Kribbella sp.]HET6293496.1 methyltransferase domain-containing protein [Kribbella sp.]
MTADEGYLLDNQQSEAGRRFDALSELFDPVTFRHFGAVGVSAGWTCWEVGAGGVSVPAWLAEQVGPSGRVVATDIDTAWMPADGAAFEVLQHDVGVEQPPAGAFDLVHARLLLTHVPQRIEALASMVRALRPGGWLVVEDADPALQPLICPDEFGPAQQLANRLRQGFRALMAGRGAELAFGRTLPRLLREAGLHAVQADAFFPITSPACTALELATVEQIRERLVGAGLATEAEIEQHLKNVASGELDLATAPLISAWGQKPRGPGE